MLSHNFVTESAFWGIPLYQTYPLQQAARTTCGMQKTRKAAAKCHDHDELSSCPAPQLWFGPGTRAVHLMVIKGLEPYTEEALHLVNTEDLRLFFSALTFPHSRQAAATKWTGEEQQFICP